MLNNLSTTKSCTTTKSHKSTDYQQQVTVLHHLIWHPSILCLHINLSKVMPLRPGTLIDS